MKVDIFRHLYQVFVGIFNKRPLKGEGVGINLLGTVVRGGQGGNEHVGVNDHTLGDFAGVNSDPGGLALETDIAVGILSQHHKGSIRAHWNAVDSAGAVCTRPGGAGYQPVAGGIIYVANHSSDTAGLTIQGGRTNER